MTTSAAAIPSIGERSGARAISGRLVTVLVGAIVLAVGAMIVDGFPVGVAHDDGMYVILAKSIATGHGYRWLHIPGAPPATHFPPGYPAVLALLWWIVPAFPANVIVFKLANALFMALAAVGVYALARARFAMTEIGAAILAVVTTIGIPTLTLSAMVMSEPLFLALLMPILIFGERLVERQQRRIRDVVLLALLVGAETLVRTHGIALIAAIVLALAMRRQLRDAAIFAAVTVAALLPWQIWVSTHAGVVPATMRGNYESYGAWFANGLHAEGVGLVTRTLARTTSDLTTMFEVLIAPSMPHIIRVLAVLLLGGLSVVGARALWRSARVSALFLALYTVIVIAWPFAPARFVWCVWPLVLLLPVLGARDVLRWRPASSLTRGCRISAVAASVLLMTGYATYNLRGYRHQWWSSIPRTVSRQIEPLVIWAATRTPKDAVLATEEESSVYLYTNRLTVPVGTFTVDQYFTPRTPAENASVIRAVVTHYHPGAVAVLSGAMRDAARELVLGNPPTFVVVDTFPDGGLVLIPRTR